MEPSNMFEGLDLVSLLQHPLSLIGVIIYLFLKKGKDSSKESLAYQENMMKAILSSNKVDDAEDIKKWVRSLEKDIDELKRESKSNAERLAEISTTLEIIRKKVLNGNTREC